MWYIFVFAFTALLGANYEEKTTVLYNSLDPSSLSELFAFYHLYPETKAGERAYRKAWELIGLHREVGVEPEKLVEFSLDVKPMTAFVTRAPYEDAILLSEKELETVERISDHLLHRKLKGHSVWNPDELFDLPNEEVDLSRAIFLYQFGKENPLQVRSYEAYLDMMALQILARLPKGYTDLQALEAINHFIFHELRYRFPPHSMWTEDVDLYTFLPSVLDSRHGVCLGVSILYLGLAQRIGLPLEIITPPGHIYLSYQKGGKTINIETTARGLDIPTEMYLGINTKNLKTRTLKEVIGLHFMNAAATAWHHNDPKKALSLYEQAQNFLHDDPLLLTFMAYNHLFLGEIKEGKALFKKIKEHPVEDALYPDTIIDDFLAKNIDAKGIQIVYKEVDERRESVLEKQEAIQKVLKSYPKFREGIFHLGVTWLQLGRNKEALECLKRYHALDPNNPTVEYYLSTLSLQRWAFHDALNHLNFCKAILEKHNHRPRVLTALEKDLRQSAPTHLL